MLPRACVVVALVFWAPLVWSLSKEGLYPSIGPDGKVKTLPDDDRDDLSSPEIQLRVPVVFYGKVYSSLFVNSNGLISFLTEIPSFSNVKFPLRFPVIAPLYTDVDARPSGRILYRETSESTLLNRAKSQIKKNFTPTSLFIVTWDSVGYYNRGFDKVNTFQAVIASNGTDSFALFLYPDNGIQWIQSDGKNPNFPDARAQAGFSSGAGNHYSLQGSGTDQVTNLQSLSNVGTPGIWIFHIGSDKITPVKEKKTSVIGSVSKKTNCASHGAAVCHTNSQCVDYTEGFCCKCNAGYYGNGQNCLKNSQPLRVNGKINGVLNGVRIKDVDVHSYVLTDKGRSYTAMSRTPPSIGYDMQSLAVIGKSIGWLFSSVDSGAKNGYQLTGGVLNRTVEIEFPQTGNHVSIKQYFKGLDAFGYIEMATDITGTVPAISEGSKIMMRDFDDQFTKVSPGLIKSHSRHAYQMRNTRLETPFTIDETIQYNECTHEPKNEKLDTLRMRTGRNFLVYDSNEQIVRYAMSNKISLMNKVNPCLNAKCGVNSVCVPDRENYKCVCSLGYELVFDNNNQGSCEDVNECTSARHNCHASAECVNKVGSFSCHCVPGFTGNGIQCSKRMMCKDLNCNIQASCHHRQTGEPECICNAGYTGDGYVCQKEETHIDCRRVNNCDANAACVYNQEKRWAECQCRERYIGDGLRCQRRTCNQMNCGSNASCRLRRDGLPQCACSSGYTGDGYVCRADNAHIDCRRVNNCDVNADCLYNKERRWAECQCKRGYRGNGIRCNRLTCNDYNCNANATCRLRQDGLPQCVCNAGFVGDGNVCQRQGHIDCRKVDNCDANAACVYNQEKQWAECQCRQGYRGNGLRCEKITCEDLVCDVNATCHLRQNGFPYCICNAGFVGDGYVCQKDDGHVDCRRVNNCNVNADCVYNKEKQWAECQCRQGYKGDGIQCDKEELTCDNLNCDVNAACRLRQIGLPECVCNSGFTGDGYVCQKEEGHVDCRRVNNCDINADCLYNREKQWAECQCKQGYKGNGTQCDLEKLTCDNLKCDVNAACQLTQDDLPECICNSGFTGDGYVCEEEELTCADLNCDDNAECQFQTDGSPECVCNSGFTGDGYACQKEQGQTDCRRLKNCDVNADCVLNEEKQRAECQCRQGYMGNGTQCEIQEITCDNLSCDVNAACRLRQDGLPECKCNSGFTGDGYVCQKEEAMKTCKNMSCDGNATCHYTQDNLPQCICNEGFVGDGYVCQKEDSVCQNCDPNAECVAEENQSYKCACKKGYKGDGLSCQKKEIPCNVLNRCHPHASCELNSQKTEFKCICNTGYEGDGIQCTIADVSCHVVNTCSDNAECVYKFFSFGYICQCKEGYAGDGYSCLPLDECNSVEDCDFNAQCLFDDVTSRYLCQCNQGYEGDGKSCKINPNAGCDVLKDCHADATCTYDSVNELHRCRCNQGFQGDGLDCTAEVMSCNVVNNCDLNADCVYEFSEQGFRCQCRQGYRGNGFSCISRRTCAEEPRLCHSNADCVLRNDINQYSCQCRAGYTGDGSICRAVPQNDGDFLLFNQGMSILKMPKEQTKRNKGKVLVMEPLQTAVGLDIDCYNGYVYWTDIAQGKINRARYNGSDVEVVLDQDLKSPEGIAVDWVSNNIYWTDSMKDMVEVMSLEGKHRKVLVSTDLKNPRGIAVHPSREKLYWADWHRDNPKIEFSNLDGTNRKVLVTNGLGLPNALTIDYTREELCWADAGTKRIECMGMHDGRRRTIASPVTYPFGLTTYQDMFYWTDWKEKFIHKLTRGGTEVETMSLPLGGNGRLYSIKAVPSQCPRGSNSCAIQNGGCRFLCLPNGQGSRVCACPDNTGNATSSELAACNEIN